MCLVVRSMCLVNHCIIFLWSTLPQSFGFYPTFYEEVPGRAGEAGACYSLREIMDTLSKPQYRGLPQVMDLLEEYRYNCKLRDLNMMPKCYPLIVIEAPRRRKRFLIAKRLARTVGGAVMFSPPLGWSKFRGAFNRTMELRRAFHSLSTYASANNAFQFLGRKPVVMSGFWLDQATFAMAKKYFPNFPPQNSSVFQWPKDLVKPDFTFFINEPIPRTFTQKKEESIRYQILQVYRHWVDPPIIELYMDDDVSVSSIIEEIVRHIDPALTPPSVTEHN